MFYKLTFYSAIICLLLPRVAATYPLYVLANVGLLRFSMKMLFAYIVMIMVMTLSVTIHMVTSSMSIAAFAVEIVLISPMLMFCLGFQIGKKFRVDMLAALRFISGALALLSLFNLIQVGFPYRIPYLHMVPDHYSAQYGLGGARIVTVMGFLLVVAEMNARDRFARGWLALAALNFLAPSYLTGIIVGILALVVSYMRSPKKIFGICILFLVITPYVLIRIDSLSSAVVDQTGLPPKIMAYLLVWQLYALNPLIAFIGVGAGQFSGEAALWASPFLSEYGSHGIPNLPGFFASDYHTLVLGSFVDTFSNSAWALSSSINKPYTGLSTLLAEFGVPLTGLLIVLFIRQLKRRWRDQILGRQIAYFTLFILLLESWHNNPWFSFMLFVLAVKPHGKGPPSMARLKPNKQINTVDKRMKSNISQ